MNRSFAKNICLFAHEMHKMMNNAYRDTKEFAAQIRSLPEKSMFSLRNLLVYHQMFYLFAAVERTCCYCSKAESRSFALKKGCEFCDVVYCSDSCKQLHWAQHFESCSWCAFCNIQDSGVTFSV